MGKGLSSIIKGLSLCESNLVEYQESGSACPEVGVALDALYTVIAYLRDARDNLKSDVRYEDLERSICARCTTEVIYGPGVLVPKVHLCINCR